MVEVDAYYQTHQEEREADDEEYQNDFQEAPERHWKRWEWYMSSRLGPEGEFVNIYEKTAKALSVKNRMQHEEKDRNINSAWTFVGPSSSPYGSSANLNGIGRVNKVVFHPLNQDTYFICTPNGGLWRTTNDGVSWTNMTDYLPCLGIADFVISWANVNVMYLLTGDPADGWDGFGYGQRSIGILKSTDGGASWHHTGVLPSTNDDYNGNALVQSPTNQNLLIAATNTGLYRTTDGGNTCVQ